MAGADDHDPFEEAGPRSIFAATWFRVVLVVIFFAVIGAVAVPYILDYMNPPPKPAVASRPPVPVLRPSTAAPPTPAAPSQPSVPTAMPAQPAPQAAAPPPSTAPATSAPVPPAPQTPASAPKPPAAAAPSPAPAKPASPSVALAPKVEPAPTTSKLSPAEPKTDMTEAEKPAPKAPATKAAAAKRSAPKRVAKKAVPSGAGSYWVQVGAFRDEGTAKRVAAKLGMPNVTVLSASGAEAAASVSAPAALPPEAKDAGAGGDLYDVFVSGGVPADITRRLAGKGLASEPTAGGVVVRPSQPLRDAVALSKDLAVEGFKVQVRRTGGAAPRPAPSPAAAPPTRTTPAPSGDALYRVRVGPYSDRAAAVAALHDLDAKGYKGFIARGQP